MARKKSIEELQAAVSPTSHKLTPEDIAQAEFMSVVFARQAELQQQASESRQARLADEWEKACQQRTAKAVEVFRQKEALSFYLK